jgi:pyruvate/2-oxoglutarate dehydrogenase complex dihydrolipoamide dehydrogenase (E3) component
VLVRSRLTHGGRGASVDSVSFPVSDIDRVDRFHPHVMWRLAADVQHRASGPKRLTNAGIELLRGTGRLAGPGVVEVDGTRHTARYVVVSTGAAPFIPTPGLPDIAAGG